MAVRKSFKVSAVLTIDVYDEQAWNDQPEVERTNEITNMLRHGLQEAGWTPSDLRVKEDPAG